MSTAASATPPERPADAAAGADRPARGLIAFAAYHIAIAALMVFAPHTFFTGIGPFGVQNDHYLRDTATFNLAFGVSLAIAYRRVVLAHADALLRGAPVRAARDQPPRRHRRGPSSLARAVRLRLARARDCRPGVARARVNPTAGGAAMTRIDLVSKRSANPFVRFAQAASRRQLGRDVDPVGVYAHTPGLLMGYGAFERATAKQQPRAGAPEGARRDQGRGDRQLRVLLRHRLLASRTTRASARRSCWRCRAIATATSSPSWRGSCSTTRRRDEPHARRPSPTSCSRALREHFDERQLVELTNVIALENMRARFNSAFDMTPAGFSEGMVCAVPESRRRRRRAQRRSPAA